MMDRSSISGVNEMFGPVLGAELAVSAEIDSGDIEKLPEESFEMSFDSHSGHGQCKTGEPGSTLAFFGPHWRGGSCLRT